MRICALEKATGERNSNAAAKSTTDIKDKLVKGKQMFPPNLFSFRLMAYSSNTPSLNGTTEAVDSSLQT